MGWEPDERWPDHVVGLAKAIADGEDVREILYDALLEIGCEKAAREARIGTIGVFQNPHPRVWTLSYVVGLILNDGYKDARDGGVQVELEGYLESVCSRKP